MDPEAMLSLCCRRLLILTSGEIPVSLCRH